MTAAMYCRVGEAQPPAAAPTRRDRAALRTDSRLVWIDRMVAAGHLPAMAQWQQALLERALAVAPGRIPGALLSPRRAPSHRLPDVLPASLDRDLAAHGFSLSSYLDRSVS